MASKPFNVREIMDTLEDDTLELVHDIANGVLTTVVLATPVGNPTLWQNPEGAPPGYVGGHARRNWQVAIGIAPSSELEGEDEGGQSTIREGEQRILNLKRLNAKIYIVNNVPYINRLNNGWSTQAPRLFVERAIQTGARVGAERKIL